MSDQLALFDVPVPPARQRAGIGPAPAAADLRALGAALGPQAWLGTSSWAFPGWAGIVYDRTAPESELSRHGLAAYSRHPMLRAAGIDRTFYAPIGVQDYAAYAAQVPDGFRFLVKAPSAITDTVLRDERGRGTADNERFLDAGWATEHFVAPALAGLGAKAGPLVFQFPPRARGGALAGFIDRLYTFLETLRAQAPAALLAVEVRDADLVGTPLVDALNAAGARYCFGVHTRMPGVDVQATRMAGLAPGPLVARWNLHAGYAYAEAKAEYAPFDRLLDPDPGTRAGLARLAAAALDGGAGVFIIANNKAEGCAPLTIIELAKALAGQLGGTRCGESR